MGGLADMMNPEMFMSLIEVGVGMLEDLCQSTAGVVGFGDMCGQMASMANTLIGLAGTVMGK